MKISCLIVDDEPLSQKVIEKFISDVDFLNLSGVCNNASEALTKLNAENEIDLLFLDINMPKISGLTFYKSLQNAPDVIFTTAYPQYAIDGFELNAIDYLLKPISFERFLTAVNKIVNKKATKTNNTNQSEYLMVKSDKTLHKIFIKNIYFIEAFGDYVKVHLEDRYLLTYSTFTNVLESLLKGNFVQSHKSYAVNLDKIKSVTGNQILINKLQIPIGQKFKSEFLKLLYKN